MPWRKPRGLSVRRPPRRYGRTRRIGSQYSARDDGDLSRARNGGSCRFFVWRAGSMDGGRRFLRSLKEQLGSLLAPAYPRPAGAFGSPLPLNSFQPRPAPRAREAAPPREPLALPERRVARKTIDRLSSIAAIPGSARSRWRSCSARSPGPASFITAATALSWRRAARPPTWPPARSAFPSTP